MQFSCAPFWCKHVLDRLKCPMSLRDFPPHGEHQTGKNINLIAMASNLAQPRKDGLQHTSDGLQPTSDGLQPSSDDLQPTSDGLQSSCSGLQPRSDGQPSSNEGWPPTPQGEVQPSLLRLPENMLSAVLCVVGHRAKQR